MDINELADVVGENTALDPLMEAIKEIMDLDEKVLNPQMVETLQTTIQNQFTQQMATDARKSLINSLEARNMTRAAATEYFEGLQNNIQDLFTTLKPSAGKEALLHAIFDPILSIFSDVVEHYHGADIELPIALEKGATVPTYAHETDTGADLAALETVVIPAHSTGTKVRTGVRIGLPENWTAYIVPRSSIGAKTPLRLSNSVGVIDSDYRGELGILYDNISDSDYTINAGDRIAQLIVMPAYHFRAQVVDILPETERNENGFGSTGQ